MIKKLRLKIIVITMIVLVAVFTSMFAALNVYMWNTSRQQTERLLEQIIQRDGMPMLIIREGTQRIPQLPPEIVDRQAPNRIPPQNVIFRAGRLFYLKLDKAGNPLEIRHEMMYDFSDEDALHYASLVLEKGKSKGSVGEFQFMEGQKDYGSIIVFAQRSIETTLLTQLIRLSLWTAGVTGIFLFIFTLFFSKWAVGPVKRAFERQRRFISDASHELKTPLTILNANADLLIQESGDSPRLQSIKGQSKRMEGLIHDLLALARTDEGAQPVFSFVDLSQAILSAALAFESHAYEEGKIYEVAIAPGLRCQGDQEQLKRLASILIDNALKHSEPNGLVKVTLSEKSALTVYNTGAGIEENERERIFERFYRSDSSRARETGGYGLGLAIAKSIVEAHRGSISVESKAGEWVSFNIQFTINN